MVWASVLTHLTRPQLNVPVMSPKLTPVDFKAVAAKGAYVYCYLREDLTPYYIGIASNAVRPFRKDHSCSVPKGCDLWRIRIFAEGLTWDEAQEAERFFIARYGRKDLGTGILRNLTEGGDGSKGHRKYEVLEATAQQYGIPYQTWLVFSQKQRQQITTRFFQGWRGEFLTCACEPRQLQAAQRYGVSVDDFLALTKAQQVRLNYRFRKGLRGAALLDFRNQKVHEKAES